MTRINGKSFYIKLSLLAGAWMEDGGGHRRAQNALDRRRRVARQPLYQIEKRRTEKRHLIDNLPNRLELVARRFPAIPARRLRRFLERHHEPASHPPPKWNGKKLADGQLLSCFLRDRVFEQPVKREVYRYKCGQAQSGLMYLRVIPLGMEKLCLS